MLNALSPSPIYEAPDLQAYINNVMSFTPSRSLIPQFFNNNFEKITKKQRLIHVI